MAINPLQLPAYVNVPQIDFSPLQNFGALADRQAAPGLIESAFGPQTVQPASAPQPQASASIGTPLNALGQGSASTTQTGSAMGFAPAIAKIESGGNYNEVGPAVHGGDRALGKYQVMASNVPQWTKEALGVSMTPEQFLASPQAQDAVFNAKFGSYVQKYGPEGAARAWFAGEGGMNNPNAKDVLGTTVAGYAKNFMGALGQGGAAIPTTAQPAQYQGQGAQNVAGMPALPGMSPQVAQRIGQMLTNPYTAPLAQALLQRYVVPPTPVKVGEGEVLVNPYTGHTVAQGQVKPVTVSEGGAAINPTTGQPIYQAPIKPMAVAPGGSLVTQAGQPVFTAPNKPVTVAPGSALVQPDTAKPVFENKSGMFDDKTLTAMADQYIAGDKSVFQNLGRGGQAAENIVALRQKVQQRMEEKGISPEQQAVKMAEYNGMIQTQKTLGSRIANIEMAVTEAQQLAPQVLETSAAVDRTRFPSINKILLAGEKGMGDPDVVKLGIALNSFINVYSRAINPGGAPTVNDKEHARELLSDAWSSGQLQAGMGQLMKEMDLARKSPDIVRKSIREQYGAGESGAPKADAGAPKVQSHADVSSSLTNAKAAIAAGAPRDAVIQRLIQGGVPKEMANKL